MRANPDGSVVRVKDVARVDLGAKTQERYSRFNGAPAAAIGIYQSPGANAVDVARHVREVMEGLKQRFPDDIAYSVFLDTTVFVTSTVAEVIRTLVIAFVLVAIVVFLFLGKLRTTLIPLVAVPVSIIGTFAVMLVIGYSANTVSLLALVLAIGIVVDDAIVVIENVERVIEEEPELSIPEATKKAMAEITGPIIAITLVLLSVFVPVAFIPGISGQLFRQFAVAVSTSMMISAINALTLSPALCSVLLKRGRNAARADALCAGRHRSRARRLCVDRPPPRARRGVRRGRRGGRGGGFARRVQGHAAGLSAGGGPGRVLRRHAAARGRLAQPHRGAGRPGREHHPADSRRAGRAVGGRPQLHRLCRLVQPGLLRHRAEALRTAHCRAQSVDAIIARLRPQLAAIQGAIVFPFNLPPILGLGNTGGFQYVLEALQGQTPTELAAVMRGLLVAANQQPELAGVFSTFAADTPQVYLDIDRDKAQVLGVKVSDVFNALQSTLGGFYVNDFNLFGRTWQVNVQAEARFRDAIEDIYRVYVRSAKAPWCRSGRWPRRGWSRGRRP